MKQFATDSTKSKKTCFTLARLWCEKHTQSHLQAQPCIPDLAIPDPKHGHARKWTGKIARRHKISDHKPNRDAASGGNGKGNQRTGVWIYTNKKVGISMAPNNWSPAPVTQIQEEIPRKGDNICHFRHGEGRTTKTWEAKGLLSQARREERFRREEESCWQGQSCPAAPWHPHQQAQGRRQDRA